MPFRLQAFTAKLPLTCVLLISFSTLLAGCSNERRQGIEGTVTMDGQPLAEGSIKLIPHEGTPGPTAGAKIENGRFSIDTTKGTFAGSFRVEILASRPSGRTTVDPETGEQYAIREQYVPAQYNTESQLTAQIKDDQANRLEFNLASK